MATEPRGVSRRQALAALAALAPTTAWAARPEARATSLLAAWQTGAEQRVGLIGIQGQGWAVQRSLLLPTRAHGLLAEAGGSVLATARRPGDWLLRWHPDSGNTQWHWIGDDRRFNGHVIASPDGRALFTSETDLDTAQGCLGVRDVRSLEKTVEWPTHGMDPHALLVLPQAVGELPAGTLMVANGGIPTLPETGRSKRQLGRMDASLVALHPGSGALLGQWRLADPLLSIRHLAWDPASRTVGVALQAEHPDRAMQQAAPVLAVWDGATLRASPDQPPLMGYGGDICALPGGGYAVSCPRADRLALFDAQAACRGTLAHAQAYALAANATQWWLASSQGQSGLLRGGGEAAPLHLTRATGRRADALQIDNHWVLLKS